MPSVPAPAVRPVMPLGTPNPAIVRLPLYMTVLRSRTAQARAALAAKLPPAELARLQHMAATWKPGSTDVPSGAPATGAGN